MLFFHISVCICLLFFLWPHGSPSCSSLLNVTCMPEVMKHQVREQKQTMQSLFLLLGPVCSSSSQTLLPSLPFCRVENFSINT
jgi:hypothetical protein